jgi:chaperonin GroEL
LTLEDIKECLENQIEGRPVVVIAPLILGEALKTINLNRNKNIIECYAVECPKIFDQGSWLEDLASFTGGKIVTRLKKFDYQEDFGSALEICFKEKEMLVEQYEDHIESTVKRIDQLQYELTQESIFYKAEQIQQRISNLQGSLLRVKVGGVTQLEAKHRRAICEKLIISLVQAVRSGILKDGLILSLSRIETGNEVLDKALRSSLEIVKKNNEMVVDEEKLKIPFPKSRAVEIISNAVSIGVLLTSVEMVVDKKKQ